MSGSRSKKSGGQYDDPKADSASEYKTGSAQKAAKQIKEQKTRKQKMLDEIRKQMGQ